ncbi:MAG: hypothetical protein ACJA08_000236 [Cyclobacteriaceae bacterium]
MTSPIKIRKNSGEYDNYSEDKLRSSLHNAGANPDLAEHVIAIIRPKLYDGIRTSEIYKSAHALLRKNEYIHASRYRLKHAIQELGPTGYPFELFVAEIMKGEGYKTQVGLTLQGKCVSHEVDVLAEKEHQLLMMECKFHNKPGYKSDVKVPLYINSRFLDLKDMWQDMAQYSGKQMQGCLVTNSKFTTDAIAYGQCAGLQMISWDYPDHASLKKRVNEQMLYPVTTLQTLSKRDKGLLIAEGIIVTKSLCENFSVLDKLGYPNSKIQKIVLEANLICEI